MALSVSVDIGGTFTDLFAVDIETGEVVSAKSLTTYDDLSRGVFDCLGKAGIAAGSVDTLVHGSTIAINIAIERNGAQAALVVTRGTRDVYQIGRGGRVQPYNVTFRQPKPFVPRNRIFEVDERYFASGEVLTPLTRAHANAVAEDVAASGAEAVAVCFLHSYAYPDHELIMGEALREAMPGAHISLSHEIVREYREYERTSTTVMNAYVGPRCRDYLNQIEQALVTRGFEGHFLIMQSNGGVISPEIARRVPVTMMESGPVGGVIASAHLGSAVDRGNLITFDMGGTTAKMSVIHGGVTTISPGYYIGHPGEGHPTMLPVVDIVEIGAGGGSIAWIDDVGALHVGPQSASSTPGPACYARGGENPTVTDANLVLGRLNPSNFLGGGMGLDVEAARVALVGKLGALQLEPIALASGIVKLAVASMVLAVRGISVERGYDPRDFALMAQGGNGPLHALEVARELGIREVLVPPMPGVFSAVGMLLADIRHDYVRTHQTLLDEADFEKLRDIFRDMEEDGRATLFSEGVAPVDMEFRLSADLRYVNQEFSLPVDLGFEQLLSVDRARIRADYDRAHEDRFGHAGKDEQVEIVNLRLVAIGNRRRKADLKQAVHGDGALTGRRPVWLHDERKPVDCAVYQRDRLTLGQRIEGPAVIEETNSTTLLWPGDVADVLENGTLLVKVYEK